MTPTLMLALASAAFLATHFLSGTPLRPALVAKIGWLRPTIGLVLYFATLSFHP